MIAEEVAESDPSDAVSVLDPAVLRVSENVPTPFKRVAEEGRAAAESEEVIETVPLYPVAVLPEASFAVTIKVKAEPAVAEAGMDESARELAVPAETVMLVDVTARVPSDAVRVEDPAVFSLTRNDPVPLVSVDAFGSVAAESVEVIATLPEYPVAVFPAASFAVTETVSDEPEIVDAGIEPKTSRLAVPGVTVSGAVFVTGVPERVAPRVTPPAWFAVKRA